MLPTILTEQKLLPQLIHKRKTAKFHVFNNHFRIFVT